MEIEMINTIEELTKLTDIPEPILKKLTETLIHIICNNLLEDVLEDKELSEFDIGLGTLYIKHDIDGIKYKFVPNGLLTSNVKDTVNKKLNLMENALTDKITKKLLEVYRDLC